MKIKLTILLIALCLGSLSISGQSNTKENSESHQYGGWYCPDNLNGFPPVDIAEWESVPVVNGRMATMEETQNGTSLIFVDIDQYPNAKPLEMKMPRLARFYSRHSGKDELIIIIQAVNISNDSIVGFRYLNGGNGSARLDEVELLTAAQIEKIAPSRFVTMDIIIDASREEVWDVLTDPKFNKSLQAIYDENNTLGDNWNKDSKVNYAYLPGMMITSEFAGDLFGNKYVQIDSKGRDEQFVEKFLLLSNRETKNTELQIVCGPYTADYENQKFILKKWAEKVKELSETI